MWWWGYNSIHYFWTCMLWGEKYCWFIDWRSPSELLQVPICQRKGKFLSCWLFHEVARGLLRSARNSTWERVVYEACICHRYTEAEYRLFHQFYPYTATDRPWRLGQGKGLPCWRFFLLVFFYWGISQHNTWERVVYICDLYILEAEYRMSRQVYPYTAMDRDGK